MRARQQKPINTTRGHLALAALDARAVQTPDTKFELLARRQEKSTTALADVVKGKQEIRLHVRGWVGYIAGYASPGGGGGEGVHKCVCVCVCVCV